MLYIGYITASGVYSFAAPELDSFGALLNLKSTSDFMLPSTIAVNILVTGLIAGRLIYAHRLLKTSTTSHNGNQKLESPYIVAMAICVESSAIIVLWAILSTITTAISSHYIWYKASAAPNATGEGFTIPIIIFPQICVCVSLWQHGLYVIVNISILL